MGGSLIRRRISAGILGVSVLSIVYVLVSGMIWTKGIVYCVGLASIIVATCRIGVSVYRRLILPPRLPISYGKWAIITGSTSGIGKEFAETLAKQGMNLLLISRSEEKLLNQKTALQQLSSIEVKYLVCDFTDDTAEREKFYSKLDTELKKLDVNGGIGLLVNNVGTVNHHPQLLEELSDKDIMDMINCNMHSTVFMSRAALKYMQKRNSGAVICISSGSGAIPMAYIGVYSATKAFITQFSRSMHIELLGTGVDFLAVTPLYVVSNLYKKESGTLAAPLPDRLVEGTLAQLGKPYVWQGHGYWFHGFQGFVTSFYWGAVDNSVWKMKERRARYAAKLQQMDKQK